MKISVTYSNDKQDIYNKQALLTYFAKDPNFQNLNSEDAYKKFQGTVNRKQQRVNNSPLVITLKDYCNYLETHPNNTAHKKKEWIFCRIFELIMDKGLPYTGLNYGLSESLGTGANKKEQGGQGNQKVSEKITEITTKK